MSHYDDCREGYCSACGAAPGNIKNGVCEICHPPEVRRSTLDERIHHAAISVGKSALASPGIYPQWSELLGARADLQKATARLKAAEAAWEKLLDGVKTKKCSHCKGAGTTPASGQARPPTCDRCSGTGRLFNGPKAMKRTG